MEKELFAENMIWPFWPFLYIFEALENFLISGLQEFRNYAGLSSCGHKIRVSDPPGNDMQMKVTFYSCPCAFTDIDPDIESFRLIYIRQAFLTLLSQEHYFLHFLRLRCRQGTDVAIHNNHQVS